MRTTMSRRKSVKSVPVPESHQPYYIVPSYLATLITLACVPFASIPSLLAYLHFIASKYDSRHRLHTIAVADDEFAAFAKVSLKYAQIIRQGLTRLGYINTRKMGVGRWCVSWCSPEFAQSEIDRHTKKDDISSMTDDISSFSENRDMTGTQAPIDSEGVGTDSAQVDLNKELKPLSPGETQGVKVNKEKPLSRKVLLREFKAYRDKIGKPMKGRRADVHFYKVTRSLINELCKRRGATPNDGLKALAYLIRNRVPHVHEEAGMSSPVYSLGYFEQTDNGKRILLECHEACERERTEAAAAVEYTQELIDDCFLATLYLRLQRTGNEALSEKELAELYRQTFDSMTGLQ